MAGRKTPRPTLTAEEKEARLTEAQTTLKNRVAELTTSEEWRKWLDFGARFHTYSFGNVILMMVQAEERGMAPLTHVAGFSKWISLKRAVRKGEKGLKIFAPMLVKKTDEETGEDVRKLVGFRLATVFDVQQTDGEPVPQRPTYTLPDGEVPDGLLNALHTFAASIGFPVDYGKTAAGVNGYTDPAGKRIVIDAALAEFPAREVRTVLHEIGHALLHTEGDYDYRTHRGVAETEAESVAYLTGTYLGLDMADYSFHYVAGWAPDAETVTKVGQRVMAAAKKILAAVETGQVEEPAVEPEPEPVGVRSVPKAELMEAFYAERDRRDAEIERVTGMYPGDIEDARERLGLKRYTLKEHLRLYR